MFISMVKRYLTAPLYICVNSTSKIQNYIKVRYSISLIVSQYHSLLSICFVKYSPNAIAHFPQSFQLDFRVHKSDFYIICKGKVTPF